MTLISNSFASTLSWIAGTLVGLVLIWSGGIKAVAPHTFRRHLQFLGWIPRDLLVTAVTLVAAFEAGWGAALVLNVARVFILPLSVLLLICFTAISWWGVKS